MRQLLLGLLIGAAAMTLILSGMARARPPVPGPVHAGFQCIHTHEGAWDANTGNGYYGGLQMDLQFQRTYATWLLKNVGTADKWGPERQIRIAYRAHHGWKKYRGRGFHPWENTARMCGLV